MTTSVTRLDDGQYWLVSQLNYPLATVADHSAQFAHAAINR